VPVITEKYALRVAENSRISMSGDMRIYRYVPDTAKLQPILRPHTIPGLVTISQPLVNILHNPRIVRKLENLSVTLQRNWWKNGLMSRSIQRLIKRLIHSLIEHWIY